MFIKSTTYLVCLLLSGLIFTQPVKAQFRMRGMEKGVKLRVEANHGYVDIPFTIQVSVNGFKDKPECEIPTVSGASLTLANEGSTGTVTQIVNGRRSEANNYAFQLSLLAPKKGEYVIPQIKILVEGKTYTTQVVKIPIKEIKRDPRIKARAILPETDFFLGQKVPLTLEFWIEEKLTEKAEDYSFELPLLSHSNFLQFDFPEATERSNLIQITGGEKAVRTRRSQSRSSESGMNYVVLTIQAEITPIASGEFTPRPARINVTEGTRFRRSSGFFNRVEAVETQLITNYEQARKIKILPPPTAGKPTSFAGAVGSGFELKVTADRTVVQTGDPVKLRIELSGNGHLPSARLPRLENCGLMKDQFRQSQGNVVGILEEEIKTFEVSVKVLKPSVASIPALEYSWFDPEIRGYRTTKSQPIALRVEQGSTVGSAEVVGVKKNEDNQQTAGTQNSKGRPQTSNSFSFSGADLAIEQDLKKLSTNTARNLAVWKLAAGYGGSIAIILLALFLRGIANADPRIRQRKNEQSQLRKQLTAAKSMNEKEAAASIAAILRALSAQSPKSSPTLDAFLSKLDALRYAPGDGGGSTISDDLFNQAQQLFQELENT